MGVVMDATERARLRALCEAAMLPLCEAADRCGEWYVVQVVPPLTVAEMWNSSAGGNVSRARAQLFAAACTALPALLDALETALRERDEARAEVERLRARLHRCAQCGADDSALAACEGDEYPLCGPCAANEIRRTLPEALRLAAVDEREACAAIADEYAAQEDVAGADACARLADAIRARGTGGVE